MSAKGLRAPFSSLVVIAALALAGCGSAPAESSASPTPRGSLGSTSTPGSGSASARPVATAVPSVVVPSAPPATAVAKPIDACTLLTDDEIQELAGADIDRREGGSVADVFASSCRWTLVDATLIVVSVRFPGGRSYYDRYFEPFIGEDFQPLDRAVEGLGDKAARGGKDTIMVVKGDALVSLLYLGGPEAYGERDLPLTVMNLVLSRLP